MANTKTRRQFNCYIKDDYVTRLRVIATAQGIPAGELVEAMLDVFSLQDLGPLMVRLSQLGHQGVDKAQVAQLTAMLKALTEA